MGNELSILQSAPQTTGDVLRDLSAEFPDFVPQSVLGNFKIFKVVHCVHEQLRSCVVKLIFADTTALTPHVDKVLEIRSRFIGPLHGNFVPFEFAEATPRAAIMVRPFFQASLFDRLYSAPHLSLGQKKFLALQMVCSVLQLHSVGLAHGNLKLDNFFVSGNLSLYLTDQGIFKPVKFPGEDPVALYSLFHEADLKRRKCFIAPERFVENFSLSFFHNEPLTDALAKTDVFGLGCSLAELFLDGPHVADLPELLLFRSGGGFDPAQVLEKLENTEIRKYIKSLLKKNPQDRPTLEGVLESLRAFCPADFCSLIFPIFTLVNTTAVYQSPDARMAFLRANLGVFLGSEISRVVTVIDEFTEHEIFQTTNFQHPIITRKSGGAFFQKLVELWTTRKSEISPQTASEVFGVLTDSRVEPGEREISASDPETLEIFIGLVCSTGAACTLSRTREVYLQILGAAVAYLPEGAVSDLVIPYVQEFVASETAHAGLRGTALEVLGKAVRMLRKSEAGIFSDYLFPGLLQGDPVQNFPCALVVASEATRLAALAGGEEFDKKVSVIRMFVERAFLRVSLTKVSAKLMMIMHMEEVLKFVEEKTMGSVLSGFFADAQWQVRCDACRRLTLHAGNFLSVHAREKILFPGVMNCLYDADERVIFSALRGAGNLVPLLTTKQRIQLAEKVFPLLHHPAKLLVGREAESLLTDCISDHLSQVDQLVFLRHWLLPHRCLEELGSSGAGTAVTPIPYDLLDQLAFKENAQFPEASGGNLANVAFEFRRQAEKLKPFIAAYARGMLSRGREDLTAAATEHQQVAAAFAAGGHVVQVLTLNGAISGLRDFRFLAELESHMRPKGRVTGDRRASALCLPATPLEVGTLSQLDGSYLNFYDVRSSSPSLAESSPAAGVSLQRDHVGVAFPGLGASAGRWSSHQPARSPEGVLLATLYEFSGERIASVDCTDDGRILAVAGEKKILCYRLGNLDREAYLSSSKQLNLSAPIRKLRMVRNSKSVVVGSGSSVDIFRLDVRSEQPLTSFAVPDVVVDLCQFDAAFESCVFALTRTGTLIGWDYRSNHAMSRLKLPTLALPSGLVVSRDASTAAVSYLSGKLTTIDLRKNIVAKTFRGMGIQAIAPSASAGQSVWLSTTGGDVCEFSLETGGAPKSHFLISDTAEAHGPIKIPHLVFADDPTFLAAHAEFEDSIVAETPFGCRAMRATNSGLFTAHNDAIVRFWRSDGVSTIPRLHTDPPVSVSAVGNVRVVAQQPPKDALDSREAHRDAITDFCLASLQTDMLVTAARDGLVKIWKYLLSRHTSQF